jgi:hypothetical protein
MASKYSYVRFRWWDPVDLDKAVEEFSSFKIKKIVRKTVGQEISLYRDQSARAWEFSSEPKFEKEKL